MKAKQVSTGNKKEERKMQVLQQRGAPQIQMSHQEVSRIRNFDIKNSRYFNRNQKGRRYEVRNNWNNAQNSQQSRNSSTNDTVQTLISALQNIQNSINSDQNSFRGFIARIKYGTNVAVVSEEKFNDAFVDSGATHHFFHNRSNFFNYEHISIESVNAASSTSKLIGKGTVQLPIDGGVIVEAYYAPEFSANILSVRLLLKIFKMESDENESGKAYCIIKDKNTSKPVLHAVFVVVMASQFGEEPGNEIKFVTVISRCMQRRYQTDVWIQSLYRIYYLLNI